MQMTMDNPFDSIQKQYIRSLHLHYFSSRRRSLKRNLNYFGLPSGFMADVRLWRAVLGSITAVERDPLAVLEMYRSAQLLGVRQRTTILRMSLEEAVELLAMDDRHVKYPLQEFRKVEQESVRHVRRTDHDIVNIDLCGGFVNPRFHDEDNDTEESANTEMLKNVIAMQSRRRAPFTLLISFETRDKGAQSYKRFIDRALHQLQENGADVGELRKYYEPDRVAKQPVLLRRFRFCVPMFLSKISVDDFQIMGGRAWYYKNYYTARWVFEPRRGVSALRMPWPPPSEIRDVLNTPLTRVEVKDGEIVTEELPAPSFI